MFKLVQIWPIFLIMFPGRKGPCRYYLLPFYSVSYINETLLASQPPTDTHKLSTSILRSIRSPPHPSSKSYAGYHPTYGPSTPIYEGSIPPNLLTHLTKPYIGSNKGDYCVGGPVEVKWKKDCSGKLCAWKP